jgi:hypothetical protein
VISMQGSTVVLQPHVSRQSKCVTSETNNASLTHGSLLINFVNVIGMTKLRLYSRIGVFDVRLENVIRNANHLA